MQNLRKIVRTTLSEYKPLSKGASHIQENYQGTKFTDVENEQVNNHLNSQKRRASIKNYAQFSGKDGKVFYITASNGSPDVIKVYNFDGHGMVPIGYLYLHPVDYKTNTYTPTAGKSFAVHVEPEYRRKGIASALYDFAEREGYNVIPSKVLHPGAAAVWKKRKPEVNLDEKLAWNEYPDFFDSLANPTFKHSPYPKVAFFNQPLLQEKRRVSDDVVNYVLNKLGITNATYLASGGYGDAFAWGDKVIKFSNDYKEAKLANQLSKHQFKHIANIEKVMRFKEKKGDWVFIIFVEKLTPIADHERPIYRYYEKVVGAYAEYEHVFKKQSKPVMSFEQVVKNIDDPSLAEFFDPHVIREVKIYDDEIIFFHNQIAELKKEVSKVMPANQVDASLADYSSTYNMGRKKDGTLAFFDLQWDSYTKDTSDLKTIKETEMTASEVNVKKLPYQFSDMITDFIAEKSIEELREIAPTLNLSQNPILIVKQMDREYPGLFDNFAQWISDKI